MKQKESQGNDPVGGGMKTEGGKGLVQLGASESVEKMKISRRPLDLAFIDNLKRVSSGVLKMKVMELRKFRSEDTKRRLSDS